jgi:hypothetical protein
MENNEGKLRKVPECGIFDFNYKIESIPTADSLIESPQIEANTTFKLCRKSARRTRS